MSYTIDERNAERQQLLASILETPTREVLARLPEFPNARCLDLGCGQGNTTQLQFADGTFDIVFCRFLLIHMAEPERVIREMLRVVKPGGFVIAFEADFAIDLSHPATAATALMNKVWQGVFQNPSIRRRLVPLFKQEGAVHLQAGAFLQLEHGESTLKRTYRLTAEATGAAAVAKGILTVEEVQVMVDGLRALEEDPDSVMMRFPDVWVIARRALQ